MTVDEFIEKAGKFPIPEGMRLWKRSMISIRKGAGVFEHVFGSGEFRRVLEIGTYRGISAAYLATFCDHVTTIDLIHGQMESLGENFDRIAFWEHMGVREKIDLILVRDDAHKAQVVPTLFFDAAFIDGGKVNIETDFDLVKRCGTVLMHDVDDRGRADDYVFKFVTTKLPPKQVRRMDIFALWCAE